MQRIYSAHEYARQPQAMREDGSDHPNEIELGKFDYLCHFPHGSRSHLFTGRPDGNIFLERFVQESWLPHIRTKVRDTTAKEYEAILQVRVFPLIGSIRLREFRPEHIDRLINHLRSLKGVRNRR